MTRRRRRNIETDAEETTEIELPDEKTRKSKTDIEAETIARYKSRIKNPLTAIRSHCVECMGGMVGEVNKCTLTQCSLYPFREGKNTMHGKYGRSSSTEHMQKKASRRRKKQ